MTVEATPSKTAAVPTEGLYTRKSSGLVREMGIRDAFQINAGFINYVFPLVAIGIALPLYVGANLTWTLLIAALAFVPLALVYAQLGTTMPRSGGDYVFLGRIFHPAVGAAAGFALLVFLVNNAGNAAQQTIYVLPFSLRAIGQALSWSAPIHAANHLTGKSADFWTGLTVMLIGAGLAAAAQHRAGRVIMWMFILGGIGILALIFSSLLTSTATFQHRFNVQSHNAAAYSQVISAAKAQGLHLGYSWSATLSMLPFAALIYLGNTFSVYPAAEIKRPGRTLPITMIAALLVCVVVSLLLWWGLRHLTGIAFLQSGTWLSANGATTASKITGVGLDPFSLTLVGTASPVAAFLSSFVLLFYVINPWVNMLLISRVLFALSFDRLLPNFITRVSRRNNSPMTAVAVALGLCTIFLWAAIYTGVASALRNVILIFTTLFLLSSIAATLLPYLKRDLYDASPKLFGGTWWGLPAITVIGAVSTVCFAVLDYFAATLTAISSGYNTTSVTVLLVSAFGGLIFYFVSRAYLRRQGIDLGHALRELPPE